MPLGAGNSAEERYYFNRVELEAIHTQLQRAAELDSTLWGVTTWCRLLTQYVDKLYGEVATLKHELEELKGRQQK